MADDGGGRIVLGVDESLAGLAAVRFAVAHARGVGMPLHAVRAWVAPQGRDGATLRWRTEIAEEAVQAMRGAFAAAMGGPPTDLPVESLVTEGFAGEMLVRYADRVDDMLVIGGRQARWPLRANGPVTGYCLRHARCPVVVVPARPLIGAVRVRRLAREIARDLRKLS